MSTVEGCIFCDIIEGRAPATLVREWQVALAIIPLNPTTCQRGMTKTWPSTTALEDRAVSELTMGCAVKLASAPCNIITSVGEAATQSVSHVRPTVCRLWGSVEETPCPFGCVPEGGRLPAGRGFELLRDAGSPG